jgi:hypothetical protein
LKTVDCGFASLSLYLSMFSELQNTRFIPKSRTVQYSG